MLSKDTQAILLLCGQWDRQEMANKPLTLSEYNRLADWLKRKGLRPKDILQSEAFESDASFSFDIPRLKFLLGRGGAMALDIERWLNSGGWIISRADKDYPRRLKDKLGKYAPPLFYGVGQRELLSKGGIAFVGSRDVSKEGEQATQNISAHCAKKHIPVISGGARGVDQVAMKSALDAGGVVIGVLASDLSQFSFSPDCREPIERSALVLISPFHPSAGFHVGNAMARNKVIYALSDAAIVISSSDGKGGTWEGAVENLHKWKIPLFVRQDELLSGNNHLIKEGAFVLPSDAFENPARLLDFKQPENVSKCNEFLFNIG